jgi:hypothetical protein
MSTQLARTRGPTPLFNTTDIRKELDEQGLYRGLETVLFPRTVVKVHELIQDELARVSTDAYPHEGSFFVSINHLRFIETEPPAYTAELPSKKTFLERLEGIIGVPYVWGGCWPAGVPITAHVDPFWRLAGVDCSGLVRFAAKGATPHRTSSLLHSGEKVCPESADLPAVLNSVRAADLIVWPGHVLVVLNQTETIEALPFSGVTKVPLKTRLEGLLREKQLLAEWPATAPTSNSFVIRRLYPSEPAQSS